MSRWFFVALFLFAVPAFAQSDMREELSRLEALSNAAQARPALDHAARALEQVDVRERAGDAAGARRAEQIARAAMTLAERQMALHEERARARVQRSRVEALERRGNE